jgi:hypothetical protein
MWVGSFVNLDMLDPSFLASRLALSIFDHYFSICGAQAATFEFM